MKRRSFLAWLLAPFATLVGNRQSLTEDRRSVFPEALAEPMLPDDSKRRLLAAMDRTPFQPPLADNGSTYTIILGGKTPDEG